MAHDFCERYGVESMPESMEQRIGISVLVERQFYVVLYRFKILLETVDIEFSRLMQMQLVIENAGCCHTAYLVLDKWSFSCVRSKSWFDD